MKIFKDKFMEWLDKEIMNEITDVPETYRYRVLQEVKLKLEEIIQEEFEKMKNDHNS